MIKTMQKIVLAWKNPEGGTLFFVKEDEKTGLFSPTENLLEATGYDNLAEAREHWFGSFPNAYDIYDVTFHTSFRKVPNDET